MADPSVDEFGLASTAFLRVLPEEFVRELESRASVRRYADGQCVFARGDPPDAFYGVESGRVRCTGLRPSGREFLLLFLDPGQWFGEMSLFDGLPRAFDAHAVGETRLHVVPQRSFQGLLDENPRFYRHFVELLCRRMRVAFAVVEDAAVLDLAPRLAKRLLGLLPEQGAVPPDAAPAVQIPQEELGRMLGASREAVGRHLKGWERQGWIRLEYGRVVVHDRAALEGVIAQAEGGCA